MSRGEWWDLCPGPETPSQGREWKSELPPDSVERIRARIEKADRLFGDETRLLPSLMRDRYKPIEEIWEIAFGAMYAWITVIRDSILLEWTRIGIPPKEFGAREKHHMEYLAVRAEERMKVCMEGFEPLRVEVSENVHELLASGSPYRGLNEDIFRSEDGKSIEIGR